MKKLCTVMLLIVAVAGLASAGGQSATKTGEAPEVSVFWRVGAYAINEDNPIIMEIERRSGVKPNFLNVPWNAYAERLNLAVASGDMADITLNNGPNFPIVIQWASEGVFLRLDELLKTAPNIQARVPQDVMETMVAQDGNTYWVPRLWVAPHTFLIREDWLDRYGLSAPENLDEFYQVAKAMQDGLRSDGIADAYAYGGFGFMFWARWVSSAFDLPIDRFKRIDGEWKYTTTVPAFRQVVEYLKRLYDEGLMDPEFLVLNPSQGREKLYQGRIGMAGMRIDDVVRANEIFASAGSDARVGAFAPPRSDTGVGGYTYNDPLNEDGIGYWMAASIARSSRKAEPAMQLMDFMFSEDGTELGFWGREGVEHRVGSDGRREWIVPVESRERIGLPMYVNFVTGEPRYGEALDDPWSDEAEAIYANVRDSVYRDFLQTPPSNVKMRELQADLGTFVNENIVNFVTGARPIGEYNAFIAEWERRGGRDLLQELANEMAKRGQ